MKFKIGDKVKIREDLVVDLLYGCDIFVSDMSEYCGKEATITAIRDSYLKGVAYLLDIDNGEWYWTDEMLEDRLERKMNDKDIISKIKEKAYENVNKKIEEEREATEEKINSELEVVNRCIDLITNELIFKRVNSDYILATPDMFFEDYSKNIEGSYFHRGIRFYNERRYNFDPLFSVNGENYYEIKYIIGKYEDDWKSLDERRRKLFSDLIDLERDREDLFIKHKQIKKLLEQYNKEIKEVEG